MYVKPKFESDQEAMDATVAVFETLERLHATVVEAEDSGEMPQEGAEYLKAKLHDVYYDMTGMMHFVKYYKEQESEGSSE